MHVFYRFALIVGIFTGVMNAVAGPAAAGEDDGRVVITAEEIAGMKAVRIADVLLLCG